MIVGLCLLYLDNKDSWTKAACVVSTFGLVCCIRMVGLIGWFVGWFALSIGSDVSRSNEWRDRSESEILTNLGAKLN